jgi:hypothetical protein
MSVPSICSGERLGTPLRHGGSSATKARALVTASIARRDTSRRATALSLILANLPLRRQDETEFGADRTHSVQLLPPQDPKDRLSAVRFKASILDRFPQVTSIRTPLPLCSRCQCAPSMRRCLACCELSAIRELRCCPARGQLDYADTALPPQVAIFPAASDTVSCACAHQCTCPTPSAWSQASWVYGARQVSMFALPDGLTVKTLCPLPTSYVVVFTSNVGRRLYGTVLCFHEA